MKAAKRLVIALALVFASQMGLPVSSADAAETRAAFATESCVLEPGTYGIVDSSNELVGILIVYPDCRTEIFVKEDNEVIV